MKFTAFEILKEFEELRLEAYDDLQPNVKIVDPDQLIGTLTIGWGTTKGVFIGQKITEQEAQQMLEDDVLEFEGYVNDIVKNYNISQNEFDALVILCYNIGHIEGTNTLSAIRNYFRSKDKVAFWWSKWIKSKGVTLRGLMKRRAKELELFFK